MKHSGKNLKKIKHCPVCGGSAAHKYRITRFSEPFTISQCAECGVQFRDEIPADPDSFYSEDYYSGKADFSYSDERKYYKYDSFVRKSRLRSIKKFIKPPAVFLDAGCAFGGSVKDASLAGFVAYGIDVSEFAVKHAVSEGLKVYRSPLTEAPFPDSFFDVITLIEVIEHLPDAQASVKKLNRLLKSGGLLVLQTADMNGKQAKDAGSDYHYYLPGHFICYTHSSLKLLLEKNGFSVIKTFRPADISLYSKLRKSAGRFRSFRDYLKWWNIIKYHLLSRLHSGSFAYTSSMVIYAKKMRDCDQ